MKRMLTGVILAAGLGCVHVQPIGPLADWKEPDTAADAKMAQDAELPEPIVRPAPRPAPPALYVTPAEVTPENVDEAVKRLNQELDADRRTMEAMPNITDVSVVR